MPAFPYRLLLVAPALVLSPGPAAATSQFLQQFGPGDYTYELVAEFEARGCTMPQAEASDFLHAMGAHISDVQATIMRLYRAGHLTGDGGQTLTLIGTDTCP